ncbi:MAG TPA: hypothetical protein VJR94_07705 [Candidatus Nitrosocosmicus sp.]|nr:hypothetical protein [Candidatus Nitrosocosmicus sp.]
MKTYRILIVISIAVVTVAGIIIFGIHGFKVDNSDSSQAEECKKWYDNLAERKAIAEQENPSNPYMNNPELDKEISEYNIACGY